MPKPAKPAGPGSVARKPILKQSFHQPNNSPNREINEWQNKWIDISSSIGILNQNFAENNELNRAESEFSKREPRYRLLILQEIK